MSACIAGSVWGVGALTGILIAKLQDSPLQNRHYAVIANQTVGQLNSSLIPICFLYTISG